MKLKIFLLALCMVPVIGICDDEEVLKDWRTPEQATEEIGKAVREMSGTFTVKEIRGINLKISTAIIMEWNGKPTVFLKPDDRDSLVIAGHNCDGRFRNNGKHVVITCDAFNPAPEIPGSFFTIQKLAPNQVIVESGGKKEYRTDPQDKGTYMIVYHDASSGNMIYCILHREL